MHAANVVTVDADRWQRRATGPPGNRWWSVCRVTDELAGVHAPLAELLAGEGPFGDRPATSRLALVGELCVLTAGSVGEALDWVTGSSDDVDFDLSGVTFIDAAGVALVVRLSARLTARRRRLKLHSPSPIVRLVFTAVELGDFFPPPARRIPQTRRTPSRRHRSGGSSGK